MGYERYIKKQNSGTSNLAIQSETEHNLTTLAEIKSK